MKMSANPVDKTNFLQSLMHMIKGNLGTGILAMPASFNHCGLVSSVIGLPILCLIATYCVHLLVRSSQHLENKMKWVNLEYAELAKGSFQTGPDWIRPYSNLMCRLVDGVLLLCQIGICCVYLVFIVDNVASILATYSIQVVKNYLFLAILPVALLLSYIRTLRRLAIASACANLLQVVGLSIVIEYLIRDMPAEPQIAYFKPLSEVALGFGSAMFAFEGISVVLPIYTRMKRQEQMGGLLGLINLSYFLLLCLYVLVGLLGYLRFGSQIADSITLNLPKEPLYDMVRAIFTISLFLSYPLQFYVPNEIIWNWVCAKLMLNADLDEVDVVAGSGGSGMIKNQMQQAGGLKATRKQRLQAQKVRYEYFCRTILVLVTFVLAVSVPKLNLMMDFFGSISGTALSITLPPLIHLVAFWEDTAGSSRWFMAVTDISIILFGLIASANGSYFSFMEILHSFGAAGHHRHAMATTTTTTALTSTATTLATTLANATMAH